MIFLDTSVLVASFHKQHIHHLPSAQRLRACQPAESCMAAHSLAEVYSRLTGGPRGHVVSGSIAQEFLDDVGRKVSRIALDADEYAAAIATAVNQGLSGAVIYDLLIARCALKAGAEVIYTWNVRDFLRLGPEITSLVRTP